MDIDIRSVPASAYERVYQFQQEYLDQEDYAEFVGRVRQNPALYLAAWKGEDLVGICYGHRSSGEMGMVLQGIAVDLDPVKAYARRGFGSALLAAFEKAASDAGERRVSLGCADDPKVEAFYRKNGYTPYELVAKDSDYRELFRMPVTDYPTGLAEQAALRERCQAHEVIFIFEKQLDGDCGKGITETRDHYGNETGPHESN